MDRSWYTGIHLDWIDTVRGFMETTAQMVEDTALADDGVHVPDWVEPMREDARQMAEYVEAQRVKHGEGQAA